MRQGGYEVETIRPLVFLDTVLRHDGLAMMLLNLMQAYAIQNGLVDEPTVRAWADEQYRLATERRFFFSLGRVDGFRQAMDWWIPKSARW